MYEQGKNYQAKIMMLKNKQKGYIIILREASSYKAEYASHITLTLLHLIEYGVRHFYYIIKIEKMSFD